MLLFVRLDEDQVLNIVYMSNGEYCKWFSTPGILNLLIHKRHSRQLLLALFDPNLPQLWIINGRWRASFLISLNVTQRLIIDRHEVLFVDLIGVNTILVELQILVPSYLILNIVDNVDEVLIPLFELLLFIVISLLSLHMVVLAVIGPLRTRSLVFQKVAL